MTSPPFLDTIDYIKDNWLRNWFCQIEIDAKSLWQLKRLEDWLSKMEMTFAEFHRILKPSGIVAFEVGEIRKSSLLLENEVVKVASKAGFLTELILINSQDFTKTANCWGIENNQIGTNTNRIVILRKDEENFSLDYNEIKSCQQISLF